MATSATPTLICLAHPRRWTEWHMRRKMHAGQFPATWDRCLMGKRAPFEPQYPISKE